MAEQSLRVAFRCWIISQNSFKISPNTFIVFNLWCLSQRKKRDVSQNENANPPGSGAATTGLANSR